MTKDEALRMALEALETELCIDWTNNDEFNESAEKMHEAITAIKEALSSPNGEAQPEQRNASEHLEPVAWLYERKDSITNVHLEQVKGAVDRGWTETPLYTTPPQRKPLTDEQRNWIVATCTTPRHIIDTVEKMHGIKE